MTATESNIPSHHDDTWTAKLDQLRARFENVRDPILVALHILLHHPDVDLDAAKALAGQRGARITAASVNAAKRRATA